MMKAKENKQLNDEELKKVNGGKSNSDFFLKDGSSDTFDQIPSMR